MTTTPEIRQVSVSAEAVRRNRGLFWRRTFADFLLVPLIVVLCFAVLALTSTVADQTHAVGFLNGARRAASHIVGKQASSAALQTIAGGLVTVTSITFSVLLLAVQQTASSLSPVVFDQFVRRRSNQAFLGFFVGLALYAYVVLAAVQDETPPILGATVATLLTVVALLILLSLVYSTISQMRATNVLRAIHDRTIGARHEEAQVVRRTRRESSGEYDVAARLHATFTGYLTGLDLARVGRALDAAEGAEIELCVSLGDSVSYGDVLAVVRDGNPERAERIARELAAALRVSRQRDLAHDPTTGIDELGNIAWTSGSTAKQNPEVAREALHALEDLALRWLAEETACDGGGQERPMAVVYRNDDLGRLVDVLYSLLVVGQESRQELFAAAVLGTYRKLIDRAEGSLRARLVDDLASARPLLDEIPSSPALRRARRTLDGHLEQGARRPR
jgi:uncharacterized membrane protein